MKDPMKVTIYKKGDRMLANLCNSLCFGDVLENKYKVNLWMLWRIVLLMLLLVMFRGIFVIMLLKKMMMMINIKIKRIIRVYNNRTIKQINKDL